MDNFENILENFNPISLKEMDSVKLLNRNDTKFMFSMDNLKSILSEIHKDYFILEIENNRVFNYKTLYFDTVNFDFYLQHHNDWGSRYKVRIRKYIESKLCFLEIKHKIKGRTVKSRIKIGDFQEQLSEKSIAFIHKTLNEKKILETKLWNSFSRITLVNKKDTERLTLDLNLEFAWNGKSYPLNNLVIGEVKQEKANRNSPFIKCLKNKGIRPMKVSKYCTGAKMIYPELKNNRFKTKHLFLNKINK